MLLTPRDEQLLCSVFELRQTTAAQLQALVFPGRTPTVASRRLEKLRTHEFLSARRLPVARAAGPSPYVYALGPAGVGVVAEHLGLPLDQVRKRQRQDSRLSWMWYPHRHAIGDVRVAFLRTCRTQSYTLTWQTDEEIAARKLPVRPDAFFTVTFGPEGPRASFFLEVQRESRPSHWEAKARTVIPYFTSGTYTNDFGVKSLRVLTVAPTRNQAWHVHEVAMGLELPQLFWTSYLAAVAQDPFGPHWFVGGSPEQAGLV